MQWPWGVTFLHHFFCSPLLFSSFCFNFSLLLLTVFTFFQQLFIKSFLINEYQRVLINKSTRVCQSPVQVNASRHFLPFHTLFSVWTLASCTHLILCEFIVIATAFGYCQLISTLSGKFYSITYSLIKHFFSVLLYIFESLAYFFLTYFSLVPTLFFAFDGDFLFTYVLLLALSATFILTIFPYNMRYFLAFYLFCTFLFLKYFYTIIDVFPVFVHYELLRLFSNLLCILWFIICGISN